MASGNRGRYLVTCVLTAGLEVSGLFASRPYALAFAIMLASAELYLPSGGVLSGFCQRRKGAYNHRGLEGLT